MFGFFGRFGEGKRIRIDVIAFHPYLLRIDSIYGRTILKFATLVNKGT
jgi:hypothetical protein